MTKIFLTQIKSDIQHETLKIKNVSNKQFSNLEYILNRVIEML